MAFAQVNRIAGNCLNRCRCRWSWCCPVCCYWPWWSVSWSGCAHATRPPLRTTLAPPLHLLTCHLAFNSRVEASRPSNRPVLRCPIESWPTSNCSRWITSTTFITSANCIKLVQFSRLCWFIVNCVFLFLGSRFRVVSDPPWRWQATPSNLMNKWFSSFIAASATFSPPPIDGH